MAADYYRISHKAYPRVRDGNFLLDGLLGKNIKGKTVGLIGTGRIGARRPISNGKLY